MVMASRAISWHCASVLPRSFSVASRLAKNVAAPWPSSRTALMRRSGWPFCLPWTRHSIFWSTRLHPSAPQRKLPLRRRRVQPRAPEDGVPRPRQAEGPTGSSHQGRPGRRPRRGHVLRQPRGDGEAPGQDARAVPGDGPRRHDHRRRLRRDSAQAHRAPRRPHGQRQPRRVRAPDPRRRPRLRARARRRGGGREALRLHRRDPPGGRSPVNPVANANEEMQGEAGDGRAKREVAQRVFAAEFNAAAHSFKESGDRSPTFVVSPFGAKVNRLFAVGVLTSTESVGASGDRYRAQVVDPTGVFNVYAGQYEPEATAQLTEIRPPAVVAIVGKSRTYQPESGVTYVSVRPESIHAVAKADRDAWILDTARHSMQRLDALREAQKMETPTPKALEDLGFPKDVAEGVCKAIEHYGKADLARYATLIRDALESLLPGGAEKMGAVPE